MNPMEDDMEIL